ncbi:MAG: hypothetical protein QOC72_2045, partial [Methylobacteriaceae bacterium]|nr:hypothetical protein [Methylobacteriaceae bacterium]
EVLVDSGPLKTVKRDLVVQFERAYLENALRRSGGNIAAAARASGKPRRVFFELMRKHGVGSGRESAMGLSEVTTSLPTQKNLPRPSPHLGN